MKKVANILRKVSSLPTYYNEIISDLGKYPYINDPVEKVACEIRIMDNFDSQKKAWVSGLTGEKTADWKKMLAAGAISSIPVGILAAIGYKNLKNDISKVDKSKQDQIKNLQDQVNSVGAASDLYALNNLYDQGMQGQGQPAYNPDQYAIDPYNLDPYAPNSYYQNQYGVDTEEVNNPYAGQYEQDPYATYNPYSQYKMSSARSFDKVAFLNDVTLSNKLFKIAENSKASLVLQDLMNDSSLSKEARDLAKETFEYNRTKSVEALRDFLLG